MDPRTKTPANYQSKLAPTPTLSDASFSKSTSITSGIPLPIINQKNKHLKLWLLGMGFLLLAAGGYIFYRILFLSPEVLFLKSLQALYESKSIISQGQTVIYSPTNNAIYSSLSAANVVQKGLFTEGSDINLTIKFNYSSDTTDQQNPKKQVAMNLHFTDAKNSEKGFERNAEIKTLNNKVYSTIKELPSLDPNSSKEGDIWAADDSKASNTSKTETNNLSFEPTNNFNNVLGNYLNGINLYKNRSYLKTLGEFTSLSSETVNGIQCYHITVHTDKEKIKLFFAKLKEENKLSDANEETANNATKDLESLDLEFWIAKTNYFPQKIYLTSKATNATNETTKVSVNINTLNGETKATIDAPQNTINPREFTQYLQQLVVISDDLNLQGFNIINSGNDSGAKPFLEKAIKYNPNNFHAYNSLGLIYANNKEYDRAIELYRTALQINPEHDKADLNLVAAFYGKGDCSDAEDEARKFITKYTQSTFVREVHWWLADAYRCENKNALAIEELNIVLQMDSSDLGNYAVYEELGGNYYQLNQFDKVVISYQQSLNLLLKNPKADKAKIVIAYEELADGYTQLKQFDKARAALTSALKYSPQLKDDQVYQSQLRGITMMENWPH